jgi:amino acid transporter
LVRGTKGSAAVKQYYRGYKVAIVIMFIILGWKFIDPANQHPFTIAKDAGTVALSNGQIHNYADPLNHGWLGVLRGAGIVFFAFIGFDAVSTAAQETKNPKKHMPIGILVSLAVCTVLYILFSYVLTGIAVLQRIYGCRKRSFSFLCYYASHAGIWLAFTFYYYCHISGVLFRNSCNAFGTNKNFLYNVKRWPGTIGIF